MLINFPGTVVQYSCALRLENQPMAIFPTCLICDQTSTERDALYIGVTEGKIGFIHQACANRENVISTMDELMHWLLNFYVFNPTQLNSRKTVNCKKSAQQPALDSLSRLESEIMRLLTFGSPLTRAEIMARLPEFQDTKIRKALRNLCQSRILLGYATVPEITYGRGEHYSSQKAKG